MPYRAAALSCFGNGADLPKCCFGNGADLPKRNLMALTLHDAYN